MFEVGLSQVFKKIQYKVLVYNREGEIIWQKFITGVGEVPGSYTRTLEELGTNPAKPTTAGIIDAPIN